jgi:hypothetical protein
MTELRKHVQTTADIRRWDYSVNDWVPLEVAEKAVADKNLERFAEIKALEDKLETFRKYIYIAPDYKHPDKEFLLLLNSVNYKFEELFGDPSNVNREPKECASLSEKNK